MSHPETTQIFTYADHKGSYLSMVGAFFFICLTEGTLIVFPILHFIPDILLQILILAAVSLFIMLLFGKLLFPLWTYHRLSLETLELHYGLNFHEIIPRAEISEALPVRENVGAFAVPHYDTRKKYFSLAFSSSGQILLRLAEPRILRFNLRGVCSTDTLLISIDRREDFLAALALSKSITPACEEKQSGSSVPSSIQVVTRTQSQLPDESEIDAPLALRTEDLTYRYGNMVAVEKLNLAVRRGEIYGFLGPNGAGKSTTIKMLVGLLRPVAGRAWLAGHDVWRAPLAAKASLGYVADRALLYDRLTGREFLEFLAQLRGLPRQQAHERIDELLHLLELDEQAGRLCVAYSFGMKRKLALAGALLHQPPVLILDEPLNGLDPLSSHRLKNLLRHLSAEDTTIFLSTHDLATAETLCRRVGIIQHGRLLAEGSAAELRARVSAPDLESVFLALTTQTEEITA